MCGTPSLLVDFVSSSDVTAGPIEHIGFVYHIRLEESLWTLFLEQQVKQQHVGAL